VMIREKSHLLLEVFPFGRKFLLATVLQYLVLRQYFDRKKHFLFLVLPLPRQILESHGGSSGASNLSHRMISADDLQVIRRCHLFFWKKGNNFTFFGRHVDFSSKCLLFSLVFAEYRRNPDKILLFSFRTHQSPWSKFVRIEGSLLFVDCVRIFW